MSIIKMTGNAEELKALNDEELEQVSGGYIYNTLTGGFDEQGYGYTKWWVIDDTNGDVLYTGRSYAEVYRYCEERHINTKEISATQLDHLIDYGHL